jgi:hypothetical protein
MQPVSKNKQYFPQISNPPTEIMADLSYKFFKKTHSIFAFFQKKKKPSEFSSYATILILQKYLFLFLIYQKY